MAAEVLKDFDWTKARSQSRSKYPWDIWMDGQVYKVVQGKDFTCKVGSMYAHIYSKSRNEFTELRILKLDDAIVFQFVDTRKDDE